MEKTITMKKGSIEKNIPTNLVSEYMQLGWKEVKKNKIEDSYSDNGKSNSFRLK